jgi:hypothetical protein
MCTHTQPSLIVYRLFRGQDVRGLGKHLEGMARWKAEHETILEGLLLSAAAAKGSRDATGTAFPSLSDFPSCMALAHQMVCCGDFNGALQVYSALLNAHERNPQTPKLVAEVLANRSWCRRLVGDPKGACQVGAHAQPFPSPGPNHAGRRAARKGEPPCETEEVMVILSAGTP